MKNSKSSHFVNFKYAIGKTDIHGRMFHSYYEIYLLLNGDVEFINDHTRQKIKPHQLVIIPPGEYHQFSVDGDINKYERCVIDVMPEIFGQEVLKNALSGKELLSLSDDDRIVQNFMHLKECVTKSDEADFAYILPAVTTDIIFLIKSADNTQATVPGNLCNLSLNLINYINAHYTEPLNLNLLSAKFYCSVSLMCHVFKNDFGISIKKYILQKRLNNAHLAIQNGKKPEQVSKQCGFSNYSTFYRAYKKHFGVSPSESKK